MRSMVEGREPSEQALAPSRLRPVPLHHLRWSPSPYRGGSTPLAASARPSRAPSDRAAPAPLRRAGLPARLRASTSSRASSCATGSSRAICSRLARRKPASPVCRVPSNSPPPRSLRSSSANRNPSWRFPHQGERALAGFGQFGAAQQQAGALVAAAPHPPAQLVQLRQAEAFGLFDHHQRGVGTSTPTSITVVATSRFRLPAGKARHAPRPCSGAQLAVDQHHSVRRTVPADSAKRASAAAQIMIFVFGLRAPSGRPNRPVARWPDAAPPRPPHPPAGPAAPPVYRSAGGPVAFRPAG